VKWDFERGLSLTAALFDLERESFTAVDPADQDQVTVIEGSNTRGLEVQLVGNLSARWSLSTGYSYLDGEVDRADGSGNDGKRTRQTPEHMFSLWTRYDLTERLSLALGGTYQDSFFVQEDNATEVPDYTRLDAAAFYRVSDRTRLQLNVENLLDENYFPRCPQQQQHLDREAAERAPVRGGGFLGRAPALRPRSAPSSGPGHRR
jgi:catecholate siderophore receptor